MIEFHISKKTLDPMEFNTPYLTEQIIAYIGNKRKLLPLIYKAIENAGLSPDENLSFFDVFSGSGVVSRFAKYLGFEVYANDWEYYAYVLNRGFLDFNKSEIEEIFGNQDEFEKLLAEINSLPELGDENQYIAKYYAPKEFDLNQVDYKTERLFYTRENALAIDKIRNKLEDFKKKAVCDEKSEKAFYLLLANLLYEAATHTNTSGVFKAFHKEFGGHGKDALSRITKKIELHSPVLIDSKATVHVFQENANELARKIKGIDIAYLDPPYNQHQYGSNYHMLNTIAKWDKIPAPLELNSKGVLKKKAAIREDWINTRSEYCYKESAEDSFEDLIMNLDARYIFISYSTDGIIPFERMREICTRRGRLSLVTNEYTTYRGGKQSNRRQNTNIEFILSIDTSRKSDEDSIREIDFILKRKKTLLLFKQRYSYERLEKIADRILEDEKILLGKIEIQTKDFFTLEIPENFDDLNFNQLEELSDKLTNACCQTKEEELEEILLRLKWEKSNKRLLVKLIPQILNKLANKKNERSFITWLLKIQAVQKTNESLYELISDKIERIKAIAERRFSVMK
ncbi:DNA adenine methylase [uncultured Treponema sp.]|uniref:DNA adenine methylase n=1 Tax=uncultured Treponema sp. TaxID=162155 RepID=UPI0025D2762B|nr:DNA adenine methylase [uncultured Treponema sp.]